MRTKEDTIEEIIYVICSTSTVSMEEAKRMAIEAVNSPNAKDSHIVSDCNGKSIVGHFTHF